MKAGLKNPMPAVPMNEAANSPTGSTIADKLSGGRGIAQEPARNVTVGEAISGGSGPAVAPDMKGFQNTQARSGKVK